jgi:hypothetical protein
MTDMTDCWYNHPMNPVDSPPSAPIMTHVSLDNQNESVKQFVLSLSVDRQGSVVELEGKEVLRVFPPQHEGSTKDQEWTDIKNERRCQLIDKKFDATLTPDEAKELEDLQDQMLRYRHRVAPLPLAYARQLLEELERKAAQANGPSA